MAPSPRFAGWTLTGHNGRRAVRRRGRFPDVFLRTPGRRRGRSGRAGQGRPLRLSLRLRRQRRSQPSPAAGQGARPISALWHRPSRPEPRTRPPAGANVAILGSDQARSGGSGTSRVESPVAAAQIRRAPVAAGAIRVHGASLQRRGALVSSGKPGRHARWGGQRELRVRGRGHGHEGGKCQGRRP
jgi:hypothetical protein